MDHNGVRLWCNAWGITMNHNGVIVLFNAWDITMAHNGIRVLCDAWSVIMDHNGVIYMGCYHEPYWSINSNTFCSAILLLAAKLSFIQ